MRKVHRLLAIVFLSLIAMGATAPSGCVNRDQVEACELECVDHGGYEWIIVGDAADDFGTPCICADYWPLFGDE